MVMANVPSVVAPVYAVGVMVQDCIITKCSGAKGAGYGFAASLVEEPLLPLY